MGRVHDWTHGTDDVGGFGNQRRTLLDEIVGAGGARIERRAWHSKDLTALFGSNRGR